MAVEKSSNPSICYTDGSSNESVDVSDEESCGFQFGCGKCRTKRCVIDCLRCCNNAKGFLVFVCIAVFVQGMAVNGLINIVISTLEKRFHLQSSETGFIAGCYDLGFLIAVAVVTYVGGRGHKPQWIGWGVFVMGVGSITFSLPHFIAPKYMIANLQSYICDENTTLTECGESHLRVYRGFFILGHLLHGIGACGLFTLAITYMDANAKESNSSVYQGIFFAFSVAGPGAGFLLGGYFVSLYTNLGEEVSADETSAHWIGNWWLGYVLCGAVAIALSVPIIMYPSQLPNTSQYRKNREREINCNPQALKAKREENFGKSIKDFPQSVLSVLRNPTIVLLSVAGAMDSGSVIALATFGPKYTEAVFRLSASNAGVYFGVGTIVSACTANVLGGIIVSKTKMSTKLMLKVCLTCAVAAFACSFVFMIQCENPDVAGVNVPFHGESNITCDGKCGCDTTFYDPVCGDDKVTYLSFCDAECSRVGNEYKNCSRIPAAQFNSSTAVRGKCEVESCPSSILLIAIASLAVFFTFVKFQPALQVSLRTVPLRQRSFAIGIQWVIMRCLGLIPLPLILGNLLDSACLVWDDICGDCGSCKLYDNIAMARYMTTLFTVAKGISITCLIIALITYKKSPAGDVEVAMNNNANLEESSSENMDVKAVNGNSVDIESYLPIQSHGYENATFSD